MARPRRRFGAQTIWGRLTQLAVAPDAFDKRPDSESILKLGWGVLRVGLRR